MSQPPAFSLPPHLRGHLRTSSQSASTTMPPRVAPTMTVDSALASLPPHLRTVQQSSRSEQPRSTTPIAADCAEVEGCRRIWVPSSPASSVTLVSDTESLDGRGNNNIAVSPCDDWVTDPSICCTVDNTKLSPRRANKFAALATHVISASPKGVTGIVLGVGNKDVVKRYVEECESDKKASAKLRRILMRTLIDLLYSYLGYESHPKDINSATPSPTQDIDINSEFCITRSEYHQEFLRPQRGLRLVQATLHFSTEQQTIKFLEALSQNYRNPLNAEAHEITIGQAKELVRWMETTRPHEVAQQIGWFAEGATEVLPPVIAAIKILLPGLQCHNWDDNKLLNEWIRGGYARSYSFEARLMLYKGREWGSVRLKSKVKGFFLRAQQAGWTPTPAQVNCLQTTKADKSEVASKADKSEVAKLQQEIAELKRLIRQLPQITNSNTI